MYSPLKLLPSLSLLLTLSVPILSAPRPESVGAGGPCTEPEIQVQNSQKLKQGPFLVSGARSDANPGGGQASWSNTWSVSTTITVSIGGDLDITRDFTKILSLGAAFTPGFSISITTGSATAANTVCPANTGSGNNYTITWGLQYYQYSYQLTGTKTYGGYDPLMNQCDADQIEHGRGDDVGKPLPWSVIFPASQAGAQNNAQNEIEFQCCTDTESSPWPNSPVCPAAS
ncbi:hypothetical protein MMC21_007166 [Puttea exsequens]|nr:hypothetical protein [Puttea exsequens]